MKNWKTSEIDILKKCYRKGTASMIAWQLNRAKAAVYQKAHELRITLPCKINFSQAEESFLRNNYLKLTNAQLATALDKKKTIVRMKLYELGLRRYDQKSRAWTEDEDIILMKNYQTMGDVALSKLIGRPKGGVCKRRKTLTLQRTSEQVALLVEQGKQKFLLNSYKPGHIYNVPEEARKQIWATRRKNMQHIKPLVESTQFVLNP